MGERGGREKREREEGESRARLSVLGMARSEKNTCH